ncbi:hypothetical protein CgunFtcFv8_021917 [Champsocephalus gunnari]|uniref:Uncharacterized protein n=1 Tax=Champsocephalus gunnari TaxID=52237 RepID=A0AAN8HWY6_CHAGU|nr:hypothetical protein CgunFtcFv8_021917 [Champsocephalus gunnari]
MQQMEVTDYVNERPRREQKRSGDAYRKDRRRCRLIFLIFGVLCMIQAILNVSLRLSLCRGPSHLECNATGVSDQKKYNLLQQRFNALTRDLNLCENRNTELNNRIRNMEDEMNRLKNPN